MEVTDDRGDAISKKLLVIFLPQKSQASELQKEYGPVLHGGGEEGVKVVFIHNQALRTFW